MHTARKVQIAFRTKTIAISLDISICSSEFREQRSKIDFHYVIPSTVVDSHNALRSQEAGSRKRAKIMHLLKHSGAQALIFSEPMTDNE
jgi:hypothetical protein